MISKELSTALGFAVREAKKRRHEYVCVEHVLYAILNHESGSDTIQKCGGNPEQIKQELEKFFDEKLTKIDTQEEYVLQQTIGFQRMIQRAINHARSAEKARSISVTFWPPFFRKKIPMPLFTWNQKGSPGWMCCGIFLMPRQRKKIQTRPGPGPENV